MFAYCGNNPINYCDSSGCIPQAVEDAIVHNKVLKKIAGQNSDLRYTQTCIYYNCVDFTDGWGFCDLYNVSTGEVWELKKSSDSWSCTTPAAQAQLKRYTDGRLKHHPDINLYTPYTTEISAGSFSYTMAGYIYSVNYWNEGAGILRYQYTKEKTDNRKKAEVAVGVLAVAAVVVYFAPATLPAIVSTGSYAYAMTH